MDITSVSAAAMTPKANASVGLGIADLSTENFRANLEELDTNSDGYLSDDEFAAYRAQKQAMGQFIPLDGPVSEKTYEAMFEALIARQE